MNGRVAKKLRREGERSKKIAPAYSKNFKALDADYRFDAELYRARRDKGLRGQIRPALVIERVINKEGEIEEVIPISGTLPPKSARFGRPFSGSNSAVVGGGQRKATVDVPMNAAAIAGRGNSRGE